MAQALWPTVEARSFCKRLLSRFIGTVDLDCDVADERCLPGDDIATVHQALVLGIHDYARKNRFQTAVLGLSGGIDSAVVAALACEAMGAENVLAVMMPSPYSSTSSITDSIDLARRLGIENNRTTNHQCVFCLAQSIRTSGANTEQ